MESKRREQKLGKEKYVESYDFRHPKLFSKEIMRNLRTLHDMFARSLSRVFSTALRHKIDVLLYGIDQLSVSEFINGIQSPSVIYLLSVEEFSGNVIMVMPPGFCIHIIERQSGGYGGEIPEARTLTTIEEKIISRIIKAINREIVIAWEPYMDFNITTATYESKPENIHVASVDPTIVVNLLIDLGGRKSNIQISYPYSMFKQAMNNSVLTKGKKNETEELSEEAFKSYKRTLSGTDVCLKPLLGTTRLTVKDIMDLEEGDVIPLNQRIDQPLEVKVNNAFKMSAYPGVVRGRRAVKIFNMVDEINEKEVI